MIGWSSRIGATTSGSPLASDSHTVLWPACDTTASMRGSSASWGTWARDEHVGGWVGRQLGRCHHHRLELLVGEGLEHGGEEALARLGVEGAERHQHVGDVVGQPGPGERVVGRSGADGRPHEVDVGRAGLVGAVQRLGGERQHAVFGEAQVAACRLGGIDAGLHLERLQLAPQPAVDLGERGERIGELRRRGGRGEPRHAAPPRATTAPASACWSTSSTSGANSVDGAVGAVDHAAGEGQEDVGPQELERGRSRAGPGTARGPPRWGRRCRGRWWAGTPLRVRGARAAGRADRPRPPRGPGRAATAPTASVGFTWPVSGGTTTRKRAMAGR